MTDEEKLILSIEANDEASQKIRKVSDNVRDLGNVSSKMGRDMVDGASKFASSVEGMLNKVNNVTRHYNYAMSGFNRMVINNVKQMGSAIYDFTTESVKDFTKFSEQHARTLGVISSSYGSTRAEQERFFQDASKLKEQAIAIGTYGIDGRGSIMDINKVSGVQEELSKSGVSADEMLNTNIVKDVVRFSEANDIDTRTATEFAVTLGNQFGVKKEDWGEMLDKVTHTADMSVIDVKDVVQSMKYAGGISSGIGRDLEETLGMIAVLGNFGLKGSQGGTGIQALFTRILTGDTTVITQAQKDIAPPKALEKFYEFEKSVKPNGKLLPMTDVIDQLDEAMSDMTDEEQAWFAKKLFGLYQMKAAYGLLNGDETDLNDVIKEIEEQSGGTNQRKLDQLLGSQYGQLTSLGNLWSGIKVDFGDRLSPFVQAIRDELFSFLSNDGNYTINFDNLRGALDESAKLIEEKYGSAIADAVRNIGGITIDLTQIGVEIGPEFADGLVKMLNSLLNGEILGSNGEFGKGGALSDWNTMIKNMKESVQDLPEDMRDLGGAVVSAIDWFGKLVTLNVATQIAELISSVLQILTIAGGAVINVAGAVIVNGSNITGGKGPVGGAVAGASNMLNGKVTGKSLVGGTDDVAQLLGTSSDDVIKTIGKKSAYSVDDIASGLGTSADDVIRTYGSSLDGMVSKTTSKLLKAGKVAGAGATAIQVASSVYESYNDFKSGDEKGGYEALGGGAGAIAGGYAGGSGGAVLGATIGTGIFPGVGTFIGGFLGGLAGGVGGSMAGDFVGRGATGIAYEEWQDSKRPRSELTAEYGNKLAEPGSFSRLKEINEWYDNELKKHMITINKDDSRYEKRLDTTGQGFYSVWASDDIDLKAYNERIGKNTSKSSFSDSIPGATSQNPYTLEDLSSSISQAITSGIREQVKKEDVDYYNNPLRVLDKPKTGIEAYDFSGATLNVQSPKLTGDIQSTLVSNISETIKNLMPQGYSALSEKGAQDLIRSHIDNQIQIDNPITVQPQFTVQAPTVNVDVKVDKSGQVSKDVNILNPQNNVMLDEWYSRKSSQYGKTTK